MKIPVQLVGGVAHVLFWWPEQEDGGVRALTGGTSGDAPKGAVPLSEAIAALREELLRACWDSQLQSLRFKPSPVELSLQVAVTSTGKGKAGVHWWLIELGGEISRESAVTQTVKMTLEPVMFGDDGQPIEFLIDAPEAANRPRENGETPLDAAD